MGGLHQTICYLINMFFLIYIILYNIYIIFIFLIYLVLLFISFIWDTLIVCCWCRQFSVDKVLRLFFQKSKGLVLNMSLFSLSAALGNDLPVRYLRLLAPPLQLLSAAVWQVVQQGLVEHYGMLEEFVTMVTELVPELMSYSQRAQLILGLRARVCTTSCWL